jgi:hypothetical protein
MSYDITFWRWRGGSVDEAQALYERLSASADGSDVVELEELPIGDINRRLEEMFPDYKSEEAFPLAELPEGSVEISVKQRGCRFDFRGGDTWADKAKIYELMTGEFGCWCYDPAAGELHRPDEPSPFKALTPEQRAFIEKNFGGLDMMSMARHFEQKQARARRIGCAVLIILAVLVALLVWGVVALVRRLV